MSGECPLPWGLPPCSAPLGSPHSVSPLCRCKAYNTVAIAVPREPVLYEFGGELIDRAARPVGVPLSPPWSSTDGGAIPRDVPAHPPSSRKRAKEERKRKRADKKKGKGLRKKSSSRNMELSDAAAAVPPHPTAGQDSWVPLLGLEAANAILSDAPVQEGLGRDPAPAPASPDPTTSGKRRKERNRKKRLKSRAEAQPAREPRS